MVNKSNVVMICPNYVEAVQNESHYLIFRMYYDDGVTSYCYSMMLNYYFPHFLSN